jgi:hypothetical protein
MNAAVIENPAQAQTTRPADATALSALIANTLAPLVLDIDTKAPTPGLHARWRHSRSSGAAWGHGGGLRAVIKAMDEVSHLHGHGPWCGARRPLRATSINRATRHRRRKCCHASPAASCWQARA